eukprot:TRINITY_DN85448_c0_g1_i1.p1 TRINITY_DN85448_c0_g1~~TRINITY_DN85448_c0_g1_i1.p1  ORF type:complete len:104 (-),score=17.40 TRINITY_DN85448_c0_g1_i1:95-406(-)
MMGENGSGGNGSPAEHAGRNDAVDAARNESGRNGSAAEHGGGNEPQQMQGMQQMPSGMQSGMGQPGMGGPGMGGPFEAQIDEAMEKLVYKVCQVEALRALNER